MRATGEPSPDHLVGRVSDIDAPGRQFGGIERNFSQHDRSHGAACNRTHREATKLRLHILIVDEWRREYDAIGVNISFHHRQCARQRSPRTLRRPNLISVKHWSARHPLLALHATHTHIKHDGTLHTATMMRTCGE